MTNRRPSEWSARRSRASNLAESLATRISGARLPTALGAIARQRLVNQIVFKPLLIDGSIAVAENGFSISLRCEESEIDEFTRKLNRDDTGRLLPWRTRFTLAHEIAHTFFFDITRRPPRSKVDFDNPRTMHSLEQSCHRAALQLLLPEATLATRYWRMDFLLPSSLRKICFDAAISAPAVIMRFRYLRRITHPFGILLCVERSPDGFVINSISRHPGCREAFESSKPGQSLRALIPDPGFLLNEGTKSELTVLDKSRNNPDSNSFTARCEGRSAAKVGALFVTLQPNPNI